MSACEGKLAPVGWCAGFLLAALAAACGGGGGGSAPAAPPTREQAVREAVRVTAAAQLEVMRRARPGLTERDVKALVDEVFRREGAEGTAFAHIVAAGAHAVDAHYSGDDGVLLEGDLLVVDIGALESGWAADLTRTIPVGAHFSARQRELYRLAVEGQELAAGRAHTGVDSLENMQAWVAGLFRASPLRAAAADGSLRSLDTFNPYRLGHYLGRDVHGSDTGWDWRQPLQAGQALTVEPGLYIASESLGLRVEDDYWAGPVGLECLSCGLPRWPDEIETVRAAGLAAPAWATVARAPLPVSPCAQERRHMDHHLVGERPPPPR